MDRSLEMDYKMIGIRKAEDYWKSLLLYAIRPWRIKPAIIVRKFNGKTAFIGRELDHISELLFDSGIKSLEIHRYKTKKQSPITPIQISDIFVDHAGYILVEERLGEEIFKNLSKTFWVVRDKNGNYILKQ